MALIQANACRAEHRVMRVPAPEGAEHQVPERVQVFCGSKLLDELEYPSQLVVAQDRSEGIRLFVSKTMSDHEISVLRALLRESADYLRTIEAYDTSDLLARIEDALR